MTDISEVFVVLYSNEAARLDQVRNKHLEKRPLARIRCLMRASPRTEWLESLANLMA